MLDAAFIDSTVLVPIEKEKKRKIRKDSEEVKQFFLLTNSFFQQPPNSDCQPLNNAIMKENIDDKTKEINYAEGTEDHYARNGLFQVDLRGDVVRQATVDQFVSVENILVDQVTKYKTRSFVGKSQETINFQTNTIKHSLSRRPSQN